MRLLVLSVTLLMVMVVLTPHHVTSSSIPLPPPLCRTLIGQTQNYLRVPDSFKTRRRALEAVSDALASRAECAAAASPAALNSLVFEVPYATVPVDDLALGSHPGIESAETLSLERSLSVNARAMPESKTTSLTLTMLYKMTVQVTLASQPGTPVALEGILNVTLATPFALQDAVLAEVELPGLGSVDIQSSDGAVRLLDVAPFDGQPGFLISDAAPSDSDTVAVPRAGSAPLSPDDVANVLGAISTAPSWGAVPVSLLASFRAAFVSGIPASEVTHLTSGSLHHGSLVLANADIYTAFVVCYPCASPSIRTAFALAAQNAGLASGASITADDVTAHAALHVAFAVTPEAVVPLAVAGVTFGMAPGWAAAVQAATSLPASAAPWPASLLGQDPELAAELVHGLPLEFTGTAAGGSASAGARILPLAALFEGAAYAGVAVPDAVFDADAAVAQVAGLAAAVQGTTGVDPALAALLPVILGSNDAQALVSNYLSSTNAPSVHGFWAFVAGSFVPRTCTEHDLDCKLEYRPAVAGALSPDATLVLSLRVPSPLPLNVPSSGPLPGCMGSINTALTSFTDAVSKAHSGLAGYKAPAYTPGSPGSVASLASAGVLHGHIQFNPLASSPTFGWAPNAPPAFVSTAVASLVVAPASGAKDLARTANVTCTIRADAQDTPVFSVGVDLSDAAAAAVSHAFSSVSSGASTATVGTNALALTPGSAATSALAAALSTGVTTLSSSSEFGWANGPLGPTSLVITDIVTPYLGTLNTLLTQGSSLLLDGGKVTGPGLRAALQATTPELVVGVELTGTASAPVLELSISAGVSAHAVTMATMAAPWSGVVDLSRMHLPLILHNTLSLSLTGASLSDVSLTTVGGAKSTGFAAPGMWQMSSMAFTTGSLAMELDLPASSSLHVVADAKTDGLAGTMASLRLTIEDTDLTAVNPGNSTLVPGMDSDASVSVHGYPFFPPPAAAAIAAVDGGDEATVLDAAAALHAAPAVSNLLPTLSSTPPKTVLVELGNTLSSVGSLAAGSLNFDVPVIDKAINAVAGVAGKIAKLLDKLTWAGELEPQLLYASVCAPAANPVASSETYTFTINKDVLPSVTCSFDFPALTAAGLDTQLEKAVAAGLSSCNFGPDLPKLALSTLLAVSVEPPFVQDSATCTVVSLKPAIPGIVRDFAMAPKSSGHHTLLPYATEWTVSSVPVFASWHDLVFELERTGINTLIHLPTPMSVQATTLPSCVPNAAWAKYFNGAVPGTSLRLSFNSTLFSDSTTWTANTLRGGIASIDIPSGSGAASLTAGIDTHLAIIHGCAPVRASSNVTISTAFVNTTADDESFTGARVPPGGGGFTLSAQFTVRSANASEPPREVSFSQDVVFDGGELVSDALLHQLVPQIRDAELAGVFSVRKVEPNAILTPGSPQVEMAVKTAVAAETGHLVLPYSMTITNITIPGLRYASPTMSQSRAAVADMAMSLVLDSGLEVGTAAGSLGPLELQAGSLHAAAKASITASANLPWLTTATALSAGTSPKALFSSFALDVAINAGATVADIELDAFKDPVPGLPELTLGLSVDDSANLASPDGLSKFISGLGVTVTEQWDGSESLVNLLKAVASRNASMCTLLTDSVAFLHDVSADPAVNTALAPLHHSPFAKVLGDILPVFDDTVTSVCSRGEPANLALFCSILKDAFHMQVGPVCTNPSLSHDAFRLPLSFTPMQYSYSDAAVLDTHLFKGGKDLAIGTAASNNVVVKAETTINIVLVVTFGEAFDDVHVSLDPKDTGVTISAFGSDTGALKLNFGPFQANVASSRAWLAASDTVGETKPATLSADLSGVTLAGSAGFEASVSFPFVATDECKVSVEVPSLASPSLATASDAGCKTFVSDLEHVMSMSWLEEFFSRPGQFFKSFSDGLAKLRAQMFGPGSVLGRYAIAFIDKKLGALLDGELASITGPTVAAEVIHQISVEIVDKVAGVTDPVTIEDIVVEIVTGALNTHLPYLTQPVVASHDAATRSYTWTLVFGQTASRPLVSVNSEWGAHGVLDLDVHCDATLDADWKFEMALVYSAMHGISLTLPTEPALTSLVSLNMPEGCTLIGGVGPIGFEVETTSAQTFLKGTVDISLAPHLDVDIDIDAQLGGEAYLGAGPLIAELAHQTPANAIMAFIHYEAGFTAGYEFNWGAGVTSTTPNKLKMQNVEMCLGTMLVKYIDGIFAHVNKVLEPLNKVFGPQGILLKPIPGMDKIFGSNFNLLAVTKYFCELTSDCNINDLVQAVETYARIMDIVNAAEEIEQLGIEGCGISKVLGDFEVALHEPVLKPNTYIPPKIKQILYNSQIAKEHEPQIAKFIDSVTTTGHYGIEYNILHDPLNTFMDMMMGVNFALVGVTIPDATVAVGMHFPIPIWPFPTVVLSLDFKASFTVSVGEVSLTYDAVYDSIHYKNPSYLFRGLGITYVNADGTPHYPLVASASMTGQVSVSVFIFTGYGYAGLTVAVQLRLNNPTGADVVTFDQIFREVKAAGLIHSLDGDLTLTFNYGLGIKACVHLVFVHKCWNIVHWGGSKVLFDHKITATSIPGVASASGALNAGIVPSSSVELVEFTPGAASATYPTFYVDLASSGDLWFAFTTPGTAAGSALPTRAVSPSKAPVVGVTGTASGPFVVVPRTSASGVSLPATTNAHLELPMEYFAPSVGSTTGTAPMYTVSQSKVGAAGHPGVSLASTCGSVSLTSPVDASVVVIEGAQCPVAAAISWGNNVSVSGTSAQYGGHGVVLEGTGGDTLSFELAETAVTVTASKLTAGTATVSLSRSTASVPVFSRLKVKGSSTKATSYTITSVPSGTDATLTGGDGDDVFGVAALSSLSSMVTVDGGGGDANVLNVALDDGVFLDVMADFVVGGSKSASSSSLSSSQKTAGLGFRNLQTVNAGFSGACGEPEVGVYAAIPLAGTSLNVAGTGCSDAMTVRYDLRGCTSKSGLHVTARGSGHHVIELGNGGDSLINYECTTHVTGALDASSSGSVTLRLKGTRDTRNLGWTFVDGKLTATDESGRTTGLSVVMSGVDRVVVSMGPGANTVLHATKTEPVEVVYTGNTTTAAVHVQTSLGSVLVNGTADVNFGVAGAHPLSSLGSPVYVAGVPGTQLNMSSATGKSAPAQWFNMDATCIGMGADQSGTPVPTVGVATAWMAEQATANGVDVSTVGRCQVGYAGDTRYELAVATGAGRDGFLGSGVSHVSVTASLGSGIDLLNWLKAGDAAELVGDLGVGVDYANFEGPINSNAHITVGADGVADVVVFWAPDSMSSLSPSLLHGDRVIPSGFSGPGASSAPSVLVSQLTTDDSMTLLVGEPDMELYPWLSGYFGGSPSVVNVTAPVGGHLSFDLNNDEEMRVVNVPVSSLSTFTAASSVAPSQVAKDWSLVVEMADLAPSKSITVEGVAGGNGTVVVVLPPLSGGASFDVEVKDLGYGGYGRVSVGGLQVTVQSVDVVVIDATRVGASVTVAGQSVVGGLGSLVVVQGAESLSMPSEYHFSMVAVEVPSVMGGAPALMQSTGSLFLVRPATSASLDVGGAGTHVTVSRACVNTQGQAVKTGVPGWIKDDVLVKRYGVAAGDVSDGAVDGCGAVLLDMGVLSVSAGNVSATGLGGGFTAAGLVASTPGAHVDVASTTGSTGSGSAVWDSAQVSVGVDRGTMRVVTDEAAGFAGGASFEVTVPSDGALVVGSGVFADSSLVALNCSGGPTKVLAFTVTDEASMETRVFVRGSGCAASVGSTTAKDRNVPRLRVSGSVLVDVDATLKNTSSAIGSVSAETRGVSIVRDGTGASVPAVSVVLVDDAAMFEGVRVRLVGGNLVTSGHTTGEFARSSMVGGGHGNVPKLEFVGEPGVARLSVSDTAVRAILGAARVTVDNSGGMGLEYCGHQGCQWSCFGSDQCSASQLRADSMFGGPCNDAPQLDACVESASWRVEGAVSARHVRAGLGCMPGGSLVIGASSGEGGAYSKAMIGFVFASAVVCVVGTIGLLVAARRGRAEYGLTQVFSDSFGWGRFVVFAMVNRESLAMWATATVDAVAGTYQVVANFGAAECSDVQPPSSAQDNLWLGVAGGLVASALVSVVAFGGAYVLAQKRDVRKHGLVAGFGRAALGIALFVFLVPSLVNGVSSPWAVLLLGVGGVLTVVGLVLDVTRLRLIVVREGSHIAVEPGSSMDRGLAAATYVLTIGAAATAALFGGRSRSALPLYGSLIMWFVALVGELLVPVSQLVRGLHVRSAGAAVATSVVSGAVGAGALAMLMHSNGPKGTVVAWGCAFWLQWVLTLGRIVFTRGRESAVEGKKIGLLVHQRFDAMVPLLGESEVNEAEPALN